MSEKRPAYPLPDTIDPEATTSFCVTIPRDTLYIGAFWRSFEYLTTWLAWASGDPDRDRAAAAVWRAAYDISRTAYEAGEECGVTFLLRQNPTNQCQLQQSVDGGTTWTLAFDYSKCGGALVGTAPYPDAPAGARDAAGNAITNIYQGLINLNPECAMTREEYITLALAYMRQFDPNYADPGALGNVYDAYCALDETGKDEAQTQCKYAANFEDILSCYDAGGLINDLNCLSDQLIDWLNDTSDALMNALNAAAAALSGAGWQAASSGSGGGGGGSGYGGSFGSECSDWVYEMDFTTDPHNADGDTTIELSYGEYAAGVGYRSVSGGGRVGITVWIGGGYSACVLTKIEMAYDGGAAVHRNGELCRVMAGDGVWMGGPESPWGDVCGSPHSIHDSTLLSVGHAPDAAAFIQVQLEGYVADEPYAAQSVSTLSRLKFWGNGYNPFTP